MPDTVLILAGGMKPTIHVQRALPPAAMCIAADSGTDHARAIGRVPDVVVGDLDSVSDDGLEWATEHGATVERHPSDKDETDLEIALQVAVASEPHRIVVSGIGGGRIDHLLANFSVLADARYDGGIEIDALVDTALVSVVHRERSLRGEIDELVSLVPMNGHAEGVTTTGLGYPLAGERLRAGSGRGVSNYFVADVATVGVEVGTLVAVQPERLIRATDGEHTPDATE